jgi:hypothetical protein
MWNGLWNRGGFTGKKRNKSSKNGGESPAARIVYHQHLRRFRALSEVPQKSQYPLDIARPHLAASGTLVAKIVEQNVEFWPLRMWNDVERENITL